MEHVEQWDDEDTAVSTGYPSPTEELQQRVADLECDLEFAQGPGLGSGNQGGVPMKMAVYYDMTFQEYREAPGLNFSSLKKIKQSPKACWDEMNRDSESTSTRSQSFGTMLHCCVLEPDRWEGDLDRAPAYVAVPNGMRMDKRIKIYKAFLESLTGDQTPSHADEMGLCEDIYSQLLKHQPMLFTQAKYEVSIFWEELVSGVRIPCKARLDAVGLDMIWDLKSCQSLAAFKKQVLNYDYHAQLAWYLRGAKAVGLSSGPCKSYLVAAESKEGGESCVYDMRDVMDWGSDIIEGWLDEYALCSERMQWPGVLEQGVVMFEAPRWMPEVDNDDDEETEGEGVQW